MYIVYVSAVTAPAAVCDNSCRTFNKNKQPCDGKAWSRCALDEKLAPSSSSQVCVSFIYVLLQVPQQPLLWTL